MKTESQHSAPVTNDQTRLASLLEGTTPGPWFKQGSYISKTPTGRRFLIAEVYRDGTVQMTEANARLIAAAPALLAEVQQLRKQRDELAAALREVKAVANDYTVALPVPAMRMYEVARAALASLEGGQG